MIRKYIISPAKGWFKDKIKNVYLELENKKEVSKQIKNIHYFPNQVNENSYIITENSTDPELCEQGLPVPPQHLWLGYGSNVSQYLNGRLQITNMLGILSASGYDIKSVKRILDFGCGAGRMIRWLKPFSDKSEIWGSDISSEHIIWANNNLKPPFSFITNTVIPHLPFEDKYFDLIYAGSVFTHIDDLTEAWLMELRRIMSAEGRLFITIHDKHTLELLETKDKWKDSWLMKRMAKSKLYEEHKRNFNMLVESRGPASQVFYDIDYFCRSVSNVFEVISVTPEAYGYQTGILLKRKN